MTSIEDCKAFALPLMKVIAVVADEWEEIPIGILKKLTDLNDALGNEVQEALNLVQGEENDEPEYLQNFSNL